MKLDLKREFKPKTDNQRNYVRSIAETDITFCTGPAGSGKTAVAVGIGLQYLAERRIDKIIVIRPTIGTDEGFLDKGIGFLPGSLEEKMFPFAKPIIEEMCTYLDKKVVTDLIFHDVIELAPMYYCRGRTFHDSFVILDEAQNASFNQIKMVLTRLGSRSKLIINGDVDQHDRGDHRSDLDIWINDIIGNDPEISVCNLDFQDIIRSPLVKRILAKVGEYERNFDR